MNVNLKPTRTLGTLLVFLSAVAAGAAGRTSFEDLVANLKSPNAKTRQEAAAALGKSRRREAVTPLAALMRDPEPRVRLEVVRALRELRDAAGVPALVTAMGDDEAAIRQETVSTLVEIYAEAERNGPISRFLQMFSDQFDRSSLPASVVVDPGVYQALARALTDVDRETRQEAALALGILGGRVALRELVLALQDPDADVRAAAVTAIGKVGSPTESRSLIPLLSDDSAEVRRRTLQALAVVPTREAGAPLREMYEANRRKELGLKVLATLSRVGDPEQAELFQQLVQDPDPEKKRLAVEGLGRISEASSLVAFKKDYQRERNEEVKLAYAFALTRLGDRAFLDTIVLSLGSRTLGTRSRDYLLEMGREVLPDLYGYLTDPEATVRASLCDVLAAIGDPGAIPHLTPLLNDPSPNVADRANRAVERLRRTGAASAKAGR